MKTSSHVGYRTLSRREAVRLITLVPAGLALVGCGRPEPAVIEFGSEAGQSGTFGVRDLQQLLDRRAQAQLHGDEEEYLAALDPSNEKLITRERKVFANIGQFGLDDVRFVIDQRVTSLPQQQTETLRFGPVVKVVKLTADAGPEGVLGPGESFEYVVSRRDDAWVVSDIVPLTVAELERREETPRGPGEPLLGPDVALLAANAPWNQHRLQVINVGNVWLAADDSVPDLEDYAQVTETEARKVTRMWGDRPRFPGHVLFFTRRRRALRSWFEFGDGPRAEGVQHDLVGVRQHGEIDRDARVAARMVIFVPFHEEHDLSRRQVIRHELVHAVTSRASTTGDGLVANGPPKWATEGFARFIEVHDEPELAARVRAEAAAGLRDGRFTASLPVTDGFYDGDPDTVSFNYALGSTVFSFVEQIADLETAIDLYAEVIQWPEASDPFVETPAFGDICQEVLAMEGPEFLDRWATAISTGA